MLFFSCASTPLIRRKPLRLPQNHGKMLVESAVAPKIHQLLPVLGSEVLTPIGGAQPTGVSAHNLQTEIKGLVAHGRRTPTGFVVLASSQAVTEPRPSAEQYWPALLALRQQPLTDGSVVHQDGHLNFTKDVEFTSPSQAASIVHGGNMNGLIAWKDANGNTLGDLERES